MTLLFPGGLAVLDNANRADGDVGANWTMVPNAGSVQKPQIIGNQFTGFAADAYDAAYWNVTDFGADNGAAVQVPVLPAAGDWVGVMNKGHDLSTTSVMDYFQMLVTPSTGVWNIDRILNGNYDPAIFSGSHAFAAGDWLGLGYEGDQLIGWWSPDGVNWTAVAGGTNTDLPVGGYVGLFCLHDVARFDNFMGGSIVAAAPSTTTPTRSMMGAGT